MPSYHTFKEQVVNGFLLLAEDTGWGSVNAPLKQVVFRHKFVMRQQPKKDLNPWGGHNGPNRRNVDRFNSSKVNNAVKRTRGVGPFALILPYERISVPR